MNRSLALLLTTGRFAQQASTRSIMQAPAIAATVITRSFSTGSLSSSPSSVPQTTGSSFIDRAKQHGSATLLGPFPTTAGRFDSCLAGLEVTKADANGDVEAHIVVGKALENSYGTLHGGAISTLVDVIGTMALLAKDHKRGGVSVDLNVNFLAAIKVGEKAILKGRVLKLGKTLGFTQVEIFTQDGKLAAIGRHTKAM